MAVRGRPFQPGNKFGRGRPRGSRNKASVAALALLERHSDALVKKLLYMAMSGDITALRMCIERLVPICKELPVSVGGLRGRTAAELAESLDTVLRQVTSGQLQPTQGQTIANMLEQQRQTIDTVEHEARLRALEAKHAAG